MNRPLYILLLKCEVESQVSKCCGQGLGSEQCSYLNSLHPNGAATGQMVQSHLLKAWRKPWVCIMNLKLKPSITSEWWPSYVHTSQQTSSRQASIFLLPNHPYQHTSNSCKCMVGSLAAAVYKNPYQYYKSRKNPYQVLQVMRPASERAMKSKVIMIKSLSPQYQAILEKI